MCAIPPAVPLSEMFVTLRPHFESAPEHLPWTFASPDPHSSPRLQARAVERAWARMLIRPQRGQGITCYVRHGLEDWRSGRKHGREGGRPLDREKIQGGPRKARLGLNGRRQGLGAARDDLDWRGRGLEISTAATGARRASARRSGGARSTRSRGTGTITGAPLAKRGR